MSDAAAVARARQVDDVGARDFDFDDRDFQRVSRLIHARARRL